MSKCLLVVGQGYVGLPLAMRAVEVGFDVIGFDADASKVKQLNAGDSYVEDISDDTLRAAVGSGRYRAVSTLDDVEGFDVAVISVPTPLREGAPDLGYIEIAAASVGDRLRRGGTVILESTTYPGTTEELVAPILEDHSGLVAEVRRYTRRSLKAKLEPAGFRIDRITYTNAAHLHAGMNPSFFEGTVVESDVATL